MAACSTPVTPEWRSSPTHRRVHKTRKLIIELLLSSGHHDCIVCEANGNCRLQDLVYTAESRRRNSSPGTKFYPTEDENPFIVRDFSRCILCGRCVQACNEVVVNRAISHGYRGSESKIVTGGDRPYHESDCVFCGQCVEVCPVGALTEKKAKGMGRPWETQKIRTTCPYCGVGCQQLLHVKDGRIVEGDRRRGRRTQSGAALRQGALRLRLPLFRRAAQDPADPQENGEFREASWDEALDLVAAKFKGIIEKHGPDAMAGVSCARSINEDSYQMQKLFRAVFKTNNIDHCART